MIVSFLLFLLYWIIWLILTPIRILPDVSLNSDITSAISSASGYIGSIYNLIPVTVTGILTALGIIISIESGVFVYKLIMWLIKKIPTIN